MRRKHGRHGSRMDSMSERIREGAKVIASDGVVVGIVEALDGDRIRLAVSEAGGQRFLPLAWIEEVGDDAIHLSVSGTGTMTSGRP